MTFLTLQSVSKSFDDHVVLAGIDLEVAAGSRTVVVGPSASGKTTLLRLIAGFEVPDEGVIALDGRILADGRQAVPAHLRGIGYVAQDGALFPHLSVEQNIGFGLASTGPERRRRIMQLLDTVELDASLLARRPDQLSGGQQQRVAIARALAQQPRLILLDEPFSALDTGLREATRKAVGRILSAAGITTILVTHDQEEALTFADQVAVLDRGELAQAGAPRDLYANPASIAVATYLGDAIVMPALVANGRATCAFGNVKIGSGTGQGAAIVLLRPEQITLVAASRKTADSAAESDACYGEVVDLDYAGAYQSVTVRSLAHRAAAPVSIVVKMPNHFAAATGAIVRLDITGDARVFAPTDC